MNAENCIFCRIVKGEIPSRKVHEDDDLLAFHDINPLAPVHLLVIPKEHIASMADLEPRHEAVMGRLFGIVGALAAREGSVEGFRVISNAGRIGRQDVPHLHVHVLGGPSPLPGMIARPD